MSYAIKYRSEFTFASYRQMYHTEMLAKEWQGGKNAVLIVLNIFKTKEKVGRQLQMYKRPFILRSHKYVRTYHMVLHQTVMQPYIRLEM